MPEIRTTRIYRDEYESDDDRSVVSRKSRPAGNAGSYRTVQRYRVTPSRVEEVEDDRRSSRLEVAPRAERIEIDRTRYVDAPERPRSTIGIPSRSTVVERYVERDREPIREREREPERDRERVRTVVYERDRREPERERPRESERDRPWERASNRPWESEDNVRETDVRIEKRVTERREEPYEVERYQKETEYYDRPEPPPAPIIIRQRAPEPQQIIVQEAPTPPPIVLPPREEQVQIVRREIRQEYPRPEPEPRRQEDEYYYRRDVREINGPRRSDEDFALVSRRDVRPRDSVSDREYSDDEDYMVRKKVTRRERSRSHSPHHKRHIAEGALAGAGVAALVANHRDKVGDGPEHRGRNIAGGAALGAIGAEVITRARSRYRDYQENRDDDESRSRSSSRHSHRKIKTALGLAAAGLAAAAAAKYISNRRAANNEELGRGRSRTRSRGRRYSDDYYSDEYSDRSRSRSTRRPKSRAASVAKAGAATAAIAGVVEHLRNKSRGRSGERSKSRVRTGAEIAGAGLAGAAVAGLYNRRQAKAEEKEMEEEDKRERRRSRTRSRSRARSVGAYSDPGVDPELGMVQYGTEPVYANAPGYVDPAAAAYGAERERSGRRAYSSGSDRDRRRKSRSRSRMRDIVAGAATTAAAATGINQYKKRREKKEAEQRERERRRYEEEAAPPENYYAHEYNDEDRHTPSPLHVSGGAYNPQPGQYAQPPADAFYQSSFTQHPNQSSPFVNEVPPHPPIPPYNPADYAGQAATQVPAGYDPYGYPPRADEHVSGNPNSGPGAEMSGGLDPSYYPPPPGAATTRGERVSGEDGLNPTTALQLRPETPPDSPVKTVMFAPLSPTSSHRLAKIHKTSHHDHQRDENLSPDPPVPEPEPSSPQRHRNRNTTLEPRSSRHRHHKRRDSAPSSSSRPPRTERSGNHHRRRSTSPSPSPSPTRSDSDQTVVLPDRFDAYGRPLHRDARGPGRGAGGETEMMEKWARDFGEVFEGKKKFKDLLGDLVGGVQDAVAGVEGRGGDGGARRLKRDSRRR